MGRFEAPKQLLEYTLNKYSEYIDNLDMDHLWGLLKADKKITKTNEENRILHDIVQLLVDECGPSIVNDIVLDEHKYQLYVGIIFDKHVNITKDQLAELEFNFATFYDGLTVYAQEVPNRVFSYSTVDGVVDLTRVKDLGDSNLLFALVRPCTVKLSTNLKKISPKALKHIASTTVEYDGTIKEFSELIDANWNNWAQKLRTEFKESVENRRIFCSDGVWDYKTWKSM